MPVDTENKYTLCPKFTKTFGILGRKWNGLISSYISRLDSQTSALLRAQSAALIGINVTVEEWLDNLQSVTKNDVMKVAKMVELQATYMLGTN